MKKKMSNFLSSILALLMLINMLSPVAVFAVEITDGAQEEQEEMQQDEVVTSQEEVVDGTDETTTENEEVIVEETEEKEVPGLADPREEYSEIVQPELKTKVAPKNDIVQMENVKTKGNIEVETHLVLPITNCEKNNIVFTIRDSSGHSAKIDLNKVNEPSDGYYEENIKLGEQSIRAVATERDKDGGLLSGVDYTKNVVYISVNLYSLDKGNYTIEMSGKHFVTYKVPVTLQDFSKRITFTDEAGMFEIGDVNDSGKVDSQDIEVMLTAIENNDSTKDLNLDGSVDIADLNYVTSMIKSSKGKYKEYNTNPIVNSENVSFEVPENVVAEDSADLSALFTEDGVVKLQQVDNKPIELGIDLSGKEKTEAVEMSEIRINVGNNAPKKMKLQIETESGEIIEEDVEVVNSLNGIHLFTEEAETGTLKVNLGKQVAVKKVTIIITETSSNNLAEIAKVEFLNNVKVKTKEPDDFYTPKNIKADTSVSEQITVTFDTVPNVTGYEIKVDGGKMNGTIFQTTYNTFTIEDLKNYTEYTIWVQSVNQEWRSGWNSNVKATPMATRKPPAPDMVVATATFAGIDFGWKQMDDTLTYNIYYRKVGDSKWTKIEAIKGVKYSLKGLEGGVEYEAYVTGNNPLGEGTASQTVTAKTLVSAATIAPKYKLINDYNQDLGRTNHVKEVRTTLGTMVGGNNFAMVDDDFTTYWSYDNWQVAASAGYDFNSPIFVLDQSYEMDEFVITVPDSFAYEYKPGTYNENSSEYNDTLVYYWEKGTEISSNTKITVRGVITTKKDKNDRKYYVLKLQDPINAEAVQFGLTLKNNNRGIQIDEVKFYQYDSLVDDVAKLFLDDLRVELAEGVTQKNIDELRARANTMDNGEYSPYRDSVLADLDYAEKILKDEALNDVIVLNPNISNYYNDHLGFAMTINDYQPLGVVARPGDTLNVYVGSTTGNVNVQLVYTQYYAEANTWSKTYALKKGQNIVTIDKIGSATSERGGSVYVRYTSKPSANNAIKVRVSGGTKIPVLDVSQLTSENEKKEKIKTYVNDLKNYNSSLSEIYSKEGGSFDAATSVLGSTEIVTKHGLLSVSSVAVENALNSGTSSVDERVNRLYESTYAFDEMMEMFYRQKGLKEGATDPKDEMPKARINIRYMRMFDGAFMYAGGYHIGIGYGSIAGLVQAHRHTAEETGYFGWGISHEIGHQINQKSTVYAEVTNNVYALLAQTSNDSDKSRLELSNIYEKIYNKVTSHTIGRDQNVFVQLGMYWQLHLYYDNGKTFDDEDSIYSRINHESRVYNNVNKYSSNDLLILFASKAAKKNLIDFFKTWGLVVSQEVTDEIEGLNLEKETKAIYYLNDAARRYRLSGGSKMSDTTQVNASITEASSSDKRVTITFSVTGDNDKILGYEILRNGEAVAFVDSSNNTYVDNVGAENNRAYTYSVVAYDYLLNKTPAKVLDEIKISHDGSVKKTGFTIESNVKDADENIDYEEDDMDYSKLEVNKLIDGKNDTYFNGTVKYKKLADDGSGIATDKLAPYVIINLGGKLSVSGIKYRAAVVDGNLLPNTIVKYTVSVSSDKVNWTVARSGSFKVTADKPEETIYFMGQDKSSESQLWTYDDVSYIKIEAVGNSNGISGSEIDVIAPPGDNVDIAMQNDTPMVGVLENDYCYLTSGCADNRDGIIEKDSVIIQGTYRGSPSFNTILIGDSNDIMKNYSGYQLIFAEINDDMTVYEVAEGTWLYVMTKEQYETMLNNSSSIRAYLYRVNDAETNDGQRLTSTSRTVTNLKPYEQLEKIQITNKT